MPLGAVSFYAKSRKAVVEGGRQLYRGRLIGNRMMRQFGRVRRPGGEGRGLRLLGLKGRNGLCALLFAIQDLAPLCQSCRSLSYRK